MSGNYRTSTPPPSSPLSSPLITPVALDRKTKTEMLLEDIRRKVALEMAQEEEEEGSKVLDVPSDLDDSSDEEEWRPSATKR